MIICHRECVILSIDWRTILIARYLTSVRPTYADWRQLGKKVDFWRAFIQVPIFMSCGFWHSIKVGATLTAVATNRGIMYQT